MKKIIFPGIIAGVVMIILSMGYNSISNSLFPSLAREYANPALFRPVSDPLMSLFFLYPFLLGLILAFVWDKTKKLFSGRDLNEKAIRFGLIYWLLTNFTGMLISYSTFPVSLLMVISWSISSLVVILGGSLVIARMSK